MVNKVILIGNLGADPELRYTPSGKPTATIRLATTNKWKGLDDKINEETEWHQVVFWGATAEFCAKYLQKGSRVYVEGRLQTRKWRDQNGNDRWTTEIVAKSIQNLTPRQTTGGQEEPPMPEPPPSTGDDVPF